MAQTLVQLLATIERPGWRWNPWRGMLEHHELCLTISIRNLSDQGIADELSLVALLAVHEERARTAIPVALLPFRNGEGRPRDQDAARADPAPLLRRAFPELGDE